MNMTPKLLAASLTLILAHSALSADASHIEKKFKVINGHEFTFVKSVDGDGSISSYVLNQKGSEVSEKDVPKGKTQVVDPRIASWLKKVQRSGDYKQVISVNIALELPNIQRVQEPEIGEGEIIEGNETFARINDQELSSDELKSFGSKLAHEQLELQQNAAKQRGELLSKWANHHKLLKAPGLRTAINQGRRGVTLQLDAKQLIRIIESRDKSIVGIEPVQRSKDTINSAMNDTNISSWALPYATTRGNGVGIYMTESGCAQDFRFSDYDRLSGGETNHSRNVGSIIKTVAPESYLYCRGGAVLPNNGDLNGVGAGNPPIYIMNRSNGGNPSSSYNTTDRDWDNYSYDNNLVSYISAGNEGNSAGWVISPAKGLNMVTVGNYSDATDSMSSSSSYRDPQTKNDKPEISAPGVNIAAGGFTMTGTSMSSPHAAAFTADMMSRSSYLKYRPYLAKAKILAGATDAIGGGYDKVGLGGIDFLSAQYSGYWSWWRGGNNSWNYFDNLDGSNDGYVTRKVYISAGWNKARVALSWMNRGSYTYNHRYDAHPIGMDLDLSVYDPNGNYIGGSVSWDNPFEDVTFSPSVSGYYTFKVKRYANNDTGSGVRMGMYVNYYN